MCPGRRFTDPVAAGFLFVCLGQQLWVGNRSSPMSVLGQKRRVHWHSVITGDHPSPIQLQQYTKLVPSMFEFQLPDPRSMQAALENDAPAFAQVFVLRGLGFEGKGDLLKAIDDYDTALRISPGNAQILFRRGLAFGRKGDLDRAIANFDEALRVNPGFVEALYARGYVWAKKRRFDRALADYDAVLRLNPSDEQAMNSTEDILSQQRAASA